LTWLALLLALSVVLAACGGDDDDSTANSDGGGGGNGGGGNVSLVAYSTPEEAYGGVIKAFQETDAGKGVKFKESYGASGDQSRAVESGLPADYVGFSLEPDITRLIKAGLVADTWSDTPTKGMVTNSVVVFVVRKGNPKNIKTWDDLVKPGIEVVIPNVFTSGGARWDVMAAWGAQVQNGKSEEEAIDYLNALYKNVAVQDDSARKSLQTFTGGKGDVLIAYENEAIFAQDAGEPIDYVVPDDTLLIENPIALTKDGEKNAAAKAFYDFVITEPAQKVFIENGYRPVIDSAGGDFPTPKNLYTIDDFGGWADVMAKFFDPEGSIMADVFRNIGKSVGK
jgi:sulfate transport system substrate-binding protein